MTEVSATPLTQEERRAYEEDGYFIRPTLFSAEEMDALGGHIEELVKLVETSDILTLEQQKAILKRTDKKGAATGLASLNNLYRIHLFSATVRAHIRDPRRLAVATALVGPDLFCPNDLYFFKPPGTGKPIAWHQDSWYFTNSYLPDADQSIENTSIGTWLALDDADEENGCLWVIPGSHRLGVVDHTDVESEAYFLQKRVQVTPDMEARGIPVEVPKGALVVFNNALLHRSTTNRSTRFRRAYIVHYMKATTRPTAQYETRNKASAEQSWGTPDAYICGQSYPGCVPTTPEEKSMNWDRALGRDLTESEIRLALNNGV
ncbi:MAG: hypothetical protein GKR89_13730 [Candidatus Latescibacteria bacterium]|nr:hypothetical protein [Candidatus Latescibacterota bacterium]